jgi:signal transduction histidine kinase
VRSLRGRLLLGAILWTLGLLAVSTIVVALSARFRSVLMAIHSHGILTAVIAMACMAIGVAVMRRALVPIDNLRRRLSDVQNGMERRLVGSYPAEVQPLVDDLNALLAHGDQALARATEKAGDLAHGLKTPLAVLSNEAERLAANGDPVLAATITQQVALMRRQVDYHLAHARAAASGTALHTRCPVAASVEGLTRTMRQLHAQRVLTIDARIDPAHAFRGRREDLDEMLGNLIDNACKWTTTRVSIESVVEAGRLIVTIDDDGRGLEASLREAVLQRGVRADEAAPGSGLGLAIVRELAELYGGTISLGNTPGGGLRARLELPAC